MTPNRKTPAAKRLFWQQRLHRALQASEAARQRMDEREAYYQGSRRIPSAGGGNAAPATNVRNIVYELIESQVDSALPQPRVTAIHPEDQKLAGMAEAMLRAQLRRMHLAELNDQQERTVPIQGGDFWQLDWDPDAGCHCTQGDLAVSLRHPRQVIPQPGVVELEQMDYLFVLVRQSRRALQQRYGVDLSEAALEAALSDPARMQGGVPGREPGPALAEAGDTEELLTQNIAYYRNEQGGIGRFSWAGEVTLEDLPDYQARRVEVCARCGQRRPAGAVRCPACGGKRFGFETLDYEELPGDVTIFGGERLPGLVYGPDVPLTAPDGTPLRDEATGGPVLAPGPARPQRVPCYRPRAYPLVLRRNVSVFGQLLGSSDVDKIADQQDAINKYGAKIQEKLLKGGSYVTLPQGVGVETTDRELKIIRLKTPADKALIDVLNIQPDTSRDQQLLETNYVWAKSTLGITDAFQGKFDSTAISGVAKQFAANQAAGRLASKREMKNAAYARLYQRMFQFMLAWADEPCPITWQTEDGAQAFAHFDRYAFLKRDAAGELYWNDEFLFEVDPASNLSSNRETLWKLAEEKYAAGAFGPPAEPESQYRLWSLLAQDGYPHAEAVRASLAQGLAPQPQQGTETAERPGGAAAAASAPAREADGGGEWDPSAAELAAALQGGEAL